ncbi:MAG TPA: Holliday junction resolvase RuvX [Pirellulaceae bacterium]|nr:Holliday junction resolvase RuvX [Pirellulaceae bacterium]
MTESAHELPRQGRLAGIDFGTVRIGVAISDAQQSLASPLVTYNRRNERLDGQFFLELAEREQIVGFVVGLPVHLSGHDSQSARRATEFGTWLRELTNRPVAFCDERFTSSWAEEILQASGATKKKRRQLLDKLAAQILLSAYLESTRQSDNNLRGIDE